MLHKINKVFCVKSRSSYDEVYRFRLWQRAVEDANELGLGYRAYCSHVKNSVAAWLSQGAKITDWKGHPINVDVLSESDMWGFLGRDRNNAKRPERRIGTAKIAVIDVYFQKLLWDSEAELNYENDISGLALAVRSFFSGGAGLSDLDQITDKDLDTITGVYIPDLTSAGSGAEISRGLSTDLYKSPPVLFIDRPEGEHYFVIHRLLTPILPEHLTDEKILSDRILDVRRWLTHQKSKNASIHSGVATVINRTPEQNGLAMYCLLRHRTLYAPDFFSIYVRNFEFERDGRKTHVNAAMEYRGENISWVYKGSQGIENIEKICYDAGFNDSYAKYLTNLFETLGVEV